MYNSITQTRSPLFSTENFHVKYIILNYTLCFAKACALRGSWLASKPPKTCWSAHYFRKVHTQKRYDGPSHFAMSSHTFSKDFTPYKTFSIANFSYAQGTSLSIRKNEGLSLGDCPSIIARKTVTSRLKSLMYSELYFALHDPPHAKKMKGYDQPPLASVSHISYSENILKQCFGSLIIYKRNGII